MTLVLIAKDLFLEGSTTKIEDKQVPGIYDIFLEHFPRLGFHGPFHTFELRFLLFLTLVTPCKIFHHLEKPTPLRQSEFLHATLRWVPWKAVTSVGSMGKVAFSHLSTLRIPDCKFHAKPKV